MAHSNDIRGIINGLNSKLEIENHQLKDMRGREAQIVQTIGVTQQELNKKMQELQQAELNEQKQAEQQRIQNMQRAAA